MHSFDKYVLSSNCVPGTTQKTRWVGNERTSRTDRCVPCPIGMLRTKSKGQEFFRLALGRLHSSDCSMPQDSFLHEQLLLCFFIRLSRVAEETIKDYFEARLALLEPVFPIACHRLCEGPDFSMDFNYRPPQTIPEGKPCFSPTLKCAIINSNNLFFEGNLNKLHRVY